jgi:hypothetical protein
MTITNTSLIIVIEAEVGGVFRKHWRPMKYTEACETNMSVTSLKSSALLTSLNRYCDAVRTVWCARCSSVSNRDKYATPELDKIWLP